MTFCKQDEHPWNITLQKGAELAYIVAKNTQAQERGRPLRTQGLKQLLRSQNWRLLIANVPVISNGHNNVQWMSVCNLIWSAYIWAKIS